MNIKMVNFKGNQFTKYIVFLSLNIAFILTLSPPVMTFVICSSRLIMFLGSLYCKQYGTRSDCSFG